MNPILLFQQSARSLKKPRTLALSAMLAALYAITMTPFLGNIVIVAGRLEIRLGYIIIGIAAMYLGYVPGILVAAVGDLLGTLLFYGGDFFFGYTFTWVVQAIIFAVFLYPEKITLPRVTLAMLTNLFVVSFFLTPLWKTLLYGGTMWAHILSNLPVNLIMFIPKVALLYYVLLGSAKVLPKVAASSGQTLYKQ